MYLYDVIKKDVLPVPDGVSCDVHANVTAEVGEYVVHAVDLPRGASLYADLPLIFSDPLRPIRSAAATSRIAVATSRIAVAGRAGSGIMDAVVRIERRSAPDPGLGAGGSDVRVNEHHLGRRVAALARTDDQARCPLSVLDVVAGGTLPRLERQRRRGRRCGTHSGSERGIPVNAVGPVVAKLVANSVGKAASQGSHPLGDPRIVELTKVRLFGLVRVRVVAVVESCEELIAPFKGAGACARQSHSVEANVRKSSRSGHSLTLGQHSIIRTTDYVVFQFLLVVTATDKKGE